MAIAAFFSLLSYCLGNLVQLCFREACLQVCQMQEEGLAEQLMQVPGHEWNDLLYIIHPTVGVSAVSQTFERVFIAPMRF